MGNENIRIVDTAGGVGVSVIQDAGDSTTHVQRIIPATHILIHQTSEYTVLSGQSEDEGYTLNLEIDIAGHNNIAMVFTVTTPNTITSSQTGFTSGPKLYFIDSSSGYLGLADYEESTHRFYDLAGGGVYPGCLMALAIQYTGNSVPVDKMYLRTVFRNSSSTVSYGVTVSTYAVNTGGAASFAALDNGGPGFP